MQCESCLQNQHCPVTDHAGENNTSEITDENVTTCLEIREGPQYSAVVSKIDSYSIDSTVS